MLYMAGIRLFMHLTVARHISTVGANITCLMVCAMATVVAAELFHRLVDYPSRVLAHMVFDWIRT